MIISVCIYPATGNSIVGISWWSQNDPHLEPPEDRLRVVNVVLFQAQPQWNLKATRDAAGMKGWPQAIANWLVVFTYPSEKWWS